MNRKKPSLGFEMNEDHSSLRASGAPALASTNTGGGAKPSVADRIRADLDEDILPDDYPIYAGYLYVADGKVYRSDWHDVTARQLKNREGFSELRRCDIHGRIALAKAEGRQ